VLRLTIGLSTAIGHLHQRGIVHKDIKPPTVPADWRPTRSGWWVLGLLHAFRASAPSSRVHRRNARLHGAGADRRMNRSIDTRSDLYSIGVTLYQMVTGSLPLPAATWSGCWHIASSRKPAQRVENIPEAVSAIIMKLLAKTAEERYQTASGLEADLRRCLADWENQHRIDEFVLGLRDLPDRLLIPEKLYGRAPEIETLLASFDRVVTTGRPELVLVSGYSGVGKSSLVNELHKALVPPRGIFASGKLISTSVTPYSTLAQAFRRLIRQLLGKSEAELATWREAFHERLVRRKAHGEPCSRIAAHHRRTPPVPELPLRMPNADSSSSSAVYPDRKTEHPLALFSAICNGWIRQLSICSRILTQSDVRHDVDRRVPRQRRFFPSADAQAGCNPKVGARARDHLRR
jgi:serine/threonine protein kinase